MGRRRFAKNSEVRHFRLVARSQSDPRGDVEGATPLVLEPFAPLGAQRRTGLSEAELLQVPQSLQEAVGTEVFGHELGGRSYETDEEEELGDEATELDGDCYFPKDGYNYDQHLKRVSGTGKAGGVGGVLLNAPKQVAQEKLNLQPASNDDEAEVLRALEHAEEYEELEDEEMEDMLPGGLAQPEEAVLWGPAGLIDKDLPDLALFRAARAAASLEEAEEENAEEEVGAGSSGGRAGGHAGGAHGLAALDDGEFEQLMAEEYGEEEIGACSDEEIEGHMSLENCQGILDEYIEGKAAEAEKLQSIYEPVKGKYDDVPRVVEETKAIIEKHYSREEDSEDTSSGEDTEDESRTWDCESVLSTLSNLSNRPGRIARIKVVKKPGPPLKAVKEKSDETGKESGTEGEEEGIVELPEVVTTRLRGETSEERKARKASVKEMRRVCRRMKKESKETYKNEAAKLPTQSGTDVRAKSRTFRL
mmetsp:Transcript_6302/g.19615  ORF Transcript_6302/g.19615 Transcript_6302/m.19615 type:complete len:476 (-) Transcript_6302:166-1593(-)